VVITNDVYTMSIDVYVQYEYSMAEFHYVDIEERPWLDHLRLIRNISVQELNISFATDENKTE
jgi:hypothetical protein